MKDFLIILREPDGRLDTHSEQEEKIHRQHMNDWFQQYIRSGNIAGGSALTLNGKQIKNGTDVVDDIHKVGTEVIGGFLLLKARDWDDAVAIMQKFPVYEFGGYAEIREFLKT